MIPAIDLRAGACVQLVGGDYTQERVRLDDPLTAAERWTAAGFEWLHVVDLDAATGRGGNAGCVERLLAARRARIQVGGGIRCEDDIARWLGAGAERVVVGTRGIEDPEWLACTAHRFPHRLVLAIDARGKQVTLHGWTQTLDDAPEEIAASVAALPLAGLLVTAVEREGRLEGPDLALVERVVARAQAPVLAAGGIASVADLDELARVGASAAIVGMALYAGIIEPSAAARAGR